MKFLKKKIKEMESTTVMLKSNCIKKKN